jgi:hypothetical protein
MDPGRNCWLAFFRLSVWTGLPNFSIKTLLQEARANPAGQRCILAKGEMTIIQVRRRGNVNNNGPTSSMNFDSLRADN